MAILKGLDCYFIVTSVSIRVTVAGRGKPGTLHMALFL
jgi:hypothetical protein